MKGKCSNSVGSCSFGKGTQVALGFFKLKDQTSKPYTSKPSTPKPNPKSLEPKPLNLKLQTLMDPIERPPWVSCDIHSNTSRRYREAKPSAR